MCTIIDKFPNLSTSDLSDEEKDKLIKKLINETDKMKKEFTILVGKTLKSLREDEVPMGDLKALLKELNAPKKSKLSKKLKKVKVISKAFEILRRFWSFFDFTILEVIIRSFCSDLERYFKDYISRFKEYCNRRVCEVPDDSYHTKLSKSEEGKKLHIQIDQTFIKEIERLKMVDLKDLSDILGKILDTDLRILKIRNGSIVLTFHTLHELDVLFPLSSKQEEELQKIGVVRIYSEEQEYYQQSSLSTTKNGT